MSLARTPITVLASQYQTLSNAMTPPTNVYLLSSLFNSYSSINSYITSDTILPFYLANVWSELNLGSTMYVSSIISPYATIVGTGNVVGGTNTLTAGISNSNFASNGFVGGCNSFGIAANVLAYGTGAQATSTNAAAFGTGSFATGAHSIAYGISSLTIVGSNQHTHGACNIADGTASHAEGISTVTYSDFCHTEGINTQIWNAINSHAEGMSSIISSGTAGHVEGLSTFVFGGLASHAEGAYTIADIGLGHAEGCQTIAFGSTAHTEGFRNVISTFVSIPFTTFLVASNTHVEGALNVGFMPVSHIEGLSSVTSGWVSHIEGLGNSNATQIAHIEGTCNIVQSADIIGNASSFVRGLSSILLYSLGLNQINDVSPYRFLSTSYLNHVQGNKNVIVTIPSVTLQTGPNILLHVEGASNSTCGSLLHIEGVSNSLLFNSRKNTLVFNAGIHIEGISNMTGLDAARAASGTHFEGIRNGLWGDAPHSQSGHLEGFCNRWIVAQEGQTPHFEGSNTGNIAGGLLLRGPHKEGIQCSVIPATNYQNGNFVCGESNAASGQSACIGQCNNAGGGAVFMSGRYSFNDVIGATVMGLCNFSRNSANNTQLTNRTILGHYNHCASNGNFLQYGGASFFHSTTNSRLIAGSAQSQYISLMCITSTGIGAYCNLHYQHPFAGLTTARASTIAYYSYWQPASPSVSYPASNQITYINVIDAKLTGYEARRSDASGGFGFYSGNFSFAVYRDNTNISNLCIYDMVSRSTQSTNIVNIIPISTTIKPINEINRLLNTPAVNLQLYARNTSLLQTTGNAVQALYGLKININSSNVINWLAYLEMSQVMRP